MDRPNNQRAVVERLLEDPAFLSQAVQAEDAGYIPTVEGESLKFYLEGGDKFDGWKVRK